MVRLPRPAEKRLSRSGGLGAWGGSCFALPPRSPRATLNPTVIKTLGRCPKAPHFASEAEGGG